MLRGIIKRKINELNNFSWLIIILLSQESHEKERKKEKWLVRRHTVYELNPRIEKEQQSIVMEAAIIERSMKRMFSADLEESELLITTKALELAKQRKHEQF